MLPVISVGDKALKSSAVPGNAPAPLAVIRPAYTEDTVIRASGRTIRREILVGITLLRSGIGSLRWN
jgi:hypothetical protein